MGRYNILITQVSTLPLFAYSTQEAYNMFCNDLEKSSTYIKILLVSISLN